MPAGVQHTSRTNGSSHRGIVVGVTDHHAGSRVDAGAVQIVGAKLYLAYAVNVRKAEQLGKKALQTPGGYLLDQAGCQRRVPLQRSRVHRRYSAP